MSDAPRPAKPHAPGALLGILTFLGGVGLLGWTFKLALDLFAVPPAQAIGLSRSKELDLAVAGESFASLLVRVLLLLVMCLAGALIATRGVKLYEASRIRAGTAE